MSLASTAASTGAVALAVGLVALNHVCRRGGQLLGGKAGSPLESSSSSPSLAASPARAVPPPRALKSQAGSNDEEDKQHLVCDVRPLRCPPDGFTMGSFNILTRFFYRRSYSDYCGERNKSWEHRLGLFRRLIPHMDFDLLAVQEANVGMFPDEFSFVKESGYEIVRPWDKSALKDPEKASRLAKTALLYKVDKFELVWSDNRSRTLLCALRHRQHGRLVYIINCHLEGNPAKVADRFSQLKSAFKVVERHQRSQRIEPSEADLVVCGDFNAGKESAPYTLLSEGRLSASFRDPYNEEEEVTKEDYTMPYAMQDAYSALREPNMPTFLANQRPSLIDFIFVSRHLTVKCNKPILTDDQWENARLTGVPNDWHPSDHFALGTAVSFPAQSAGDQPR